MKTDKVNIFKAKLRVEKFRMDKLSKTDFLNLICHLKNDKIDLESFDFKQVIDGGLPGDDILPSINDKIEILERHYYKSLKFSHLNSFYELLINIHLLLGSTSVNILVARFIFNYSIHEFEKAEDLLDEIKDKISGLSKTTQNEFYEILRFFDNTIDRKKNFFEIHDLRKYEPKHVVVITGDNEMMNPQYYWQKEMEEAVLKSNMRKDINPNLKPWREKLLYVNRQKRIHSANFKAIDDLLDAIPEDVDIIIINAHGNSKEIQLHFDLGQNRFNSIPVVINTNAFLNKLFQKVGRDKVVIFTSCNFKKDNSTPQFKALIGNSLHIRPSEILPFIYGFMSFSLYDKEMNSSDIEKYFNQAVIFASIFSDSSKYWKLYS